MRLLLTKVYLFVSWLPLALYFSASAMVEDTEGWSAWAAAGVLVYPVAASAVLGSFGVILSILSFRNGEKRPGPITATFLSGSLFIWFTGSAIINELQRSF